MPSTLRTVTDLVATSSAPAVAEIQGLYGPFSFPEKLLQKIWLRGDFDQGRAVTADGRRLRVNFPGKWNLLGGPDFREARVRFDDGAEQTGDVELHLRAADWAAHAHAKDAAYDRVMLHVVLFPPGEQRTTAGGGGREIPVLALLPLLHHDLEEFAADEAVELLSGRASRGLPDELAAMESAELLAMLRQHAAKRWQQKVHFARLRVQRLGWESACHHTALEILGYRFNRAPMLRLATAHPLGEWARGAVAPEEAYAAEAGHWSVQGVRPANHPRTRLRQYAAWTKRVPAWPARLAGLSEAILSLAPGTSARMESTRDARRELALGDLRDRLAAEICGDQLGGTRFDNLVCDGLLPLLASQRKGDTGSPDSFQNCWFHWFPGDLPPVVSKGLRRFGVFDGRSQPACHGLAQGLLGWLLERDPR